jgi:hypothetical protein
VESYKGVRKVISGVPNFDERAERPTDITCRQIARTPGLSSREDLEAGAATTEGS